MIDTAETTLVKSRTHTKPILLAYKRRALLLASLSAVLAMLELAGLMLFSSIGDAVLDTEVTPSLGRDIASAITFSSDELSLFRLALVFLIATALALPLQLIVRYVAVRWMTDLTATLSESVVKSILWRPVRPRHRLEHGELIHVAMTAPVHGGRIAQHLADAIWTVIFAIGVFAGLTVASPLLLLIAIGAGLVTALGIIMPARLVVERAQRTRNQQQGRASAVASAAVRNLREIKSFSMETAWMARYRAHSKAWTDAYGRSDWASTSPAYVVRSASQLMFGAGVALVASIWTGDDLSSRLVIFSTFAYGMFRVFPILNLLGRSWIGIGQCTPFLDSIHNTVSSDSDDLGLRGKSVEPFTQGIRFENVSFAYDERTPVLRGASFQIPQGSFSVISGSTGAGKSTILDLLLKFESVDSGTVSVDGTDISEMDRTSWLSQVGLVAQDVLLFPGSIRSNLEIAKSEATDGELKRACVTAGIWDFIESSPDGFETVVGEYGEEISGGQRQRLAIARALLGSPRLLVLDEATSALDRITEKQVIENILGSVQELTVVMVTHREQVLQLADQVLVLEDGQVNARSG